MNEFLENMLKNVNDEYDKSEGGLFWDTLAPASIEFDKAYEEMYYLFDMANPLTSERYFLDLCIKGRVGDRVERRQATYAIGTVKIKGNIGTVIPIGTKVASGDIIFKTIEEKTLDKDTVDVKVQCEKAGIIGNVLANTIKSFPVTVQGLHEVINQEATKGGYDTETDASLLERYLIAVREPATSGNIYHYRRWTMEVEGVGAVKVFPLWNGNGTVKLVIVDYKMEVADQGLIDKVKKHIEEVRPIGATVTITSAVNKDITVKVKAKLIDGTRLQDVQDSFKKSIEEYLKSTAFKTDYISIAKIGNLLLNTKNVLDYTELKLNDNTANIELGQEEIAKLTDCKVEVIE